ncbi:MAG: magnesium/cobalt transporter CorA [Melioribacteraceae bacterium]|nr:magnesium/cobalt transporter CorA [Melioribacteraceae bacterium]
MKDFWKMNVDKVGEPPGSLVFIGDASDPEIPSITVRQYNMERFDEDIIENIETVDTNSEAKTNWLHITGLSNLDIIRSIGNKFDIHTLLLEDILNTEHLAKYEEAEDYIAFLLKSFYRDEEDGCLKLNHNCIILKDNNVVLFQERKSSYLSAKIERIKLGQGKARKKKADYLFYVLIDAFVDSYFIAFHELENKINDLEEDLLCEAHINRIEDIHLLKKQILEYKKYLFPLEDAFNLMLKEIPDIIEEENYKYLRDIKDHILLLKETYHSCNEMIKELIDLNETNINNSNNSVMKVLTIIATIFIPLTFIAGLYGMNFKNMPELEWDFGYFLALGVMFVIGIATVVIMKIKKWI